MKLLLKFYIIIIFTLLGTNNIFSQDDNLQLGKSTTTPAAAVYDLSDPQGVNMEVNMWGFVRYPGRYKVPINTTFMDLMSYSGGPLENSNLEEIRIIRGANDSTGKKGQVIKLNYNDMLWENKVHSDTKRNPVLQQGDFVVVMQEVRLKFRDDLMLIIPIITTVISLATFIISVRK